MAASENQLHPPTAQDSAQQEQQKFQGGQQSVKEKSSKTEEPSGSRKDSTEDEKLGSTKESKEDEKLGSRKESKVDENLSSRKGSKENEKLEVTKERKESEISDVISRIDSPARASILSERTDDGSLVPEGGKPKRAPSAKLMSAKEHFPMVGYQPTLLRVLVSKVLK